MSSPAKMEAPRKSTTRSAWPIVVVATLGMSVSYIDRQTLAAIAPSVTKALRIDNSHYGLLVAAFSMAYLVASPVSGVFVDRYGARRSFAAAVVLWSIVAAIHALAPSFGALFALRVLLGTAESPSFPSAAQSIRRALPGARRGLAFGLLFTGSSLGAIAAAKVAVPLDARYGYRTAFLATAAIGALWIPAWLFFTRGHVLDPEPAEHKEADSPAATTTPPASWLAVATSAPVLRTVVACGGVAPLLMFTLNWSSKYLVDGWKLPPHAVENFLVWPPIVFDVGAIGFGMLASRLGERTGGSPRVLVVVALLLSASLALTPLAPSPAAAIALFSIAGCGGGGIYVLATNDMLARVPLERTSAAGGIAAAAQSLAHIIAGPLIGWTIDRTGGHTVALVVLGAIVVPTSLAWVFWPGFRTPPSAVRA